MRFGENENRWPTGSNWGSLYSEGPQYQGNGAFPAGSASASLSSQGYNGPQWHASPGSWQTGGNNAVRGAGASASSAHFSSSLYAYSYPAGGQIPNNVGNQQRGSRDRYSTSEHDDDQDQDQDQGGGGDTTN
ncbi:uncharacterized protein K452DRAFT_286706 [Aplosporella prunicola CBS 121167]|uniref:Uncharacterized protein n=1 Tax=Aplosporella prunicola CBS 121167 TaxID=1176127 RepID=A0A6A6BKI2_9PEZI|nr:uncharacterized protein K452DRAFT_286706 [Aplosporella prunicola CBS 121167]KAF2143081.1 hypothetical protein K452DRAFT_286706 [Aplosporella prunicola CBS 121167]